MDKAVQQLVDIVHTFRTYRSLSKPISNFIFALNASVVIKTPAKVASLKERSNGLVTLIARRLAQSSTKLPEHESSGGATGAYKRRGSEEQVVEELAWNGPFDVERTGRLGAKATQQRCERELQRRAAAYTSA